MDVVLHKSAFDVLDLNDCVSYCISKYMLVILLKGIVHPKIKILSIGYYQIVPNLLTFFCKLKSSSFGPYWLSKWFFILWKSIGTKKFGTTKKWVNARMFIIEWSVHVIDTVLNLDWFCFTGVLITSTNTNLQQPSKSLLKHE